MQYTPYYNLPYYEANDIANYLDTYNNTIIALDKAIHDAQTKAESGEIHGEELDKEIESLTSRVSALETSLSSTIENLSALSTTVSGHTEELAKVTEDLLAQNTAVKSLSNSVTELSVQFSAFKTTQENFNSEISAKVGNRFFKTYKYSIGSSPNKEQYTANFTIETGLANDENFTKSHVMLNFMQTMADEKKASAVFNSAFTTTESIYNYTVDGIRYNVRINFNSSTGNIGIRITGQKQEAPGSLFANAIVYTD
jgi:DNA repair ATPase RecN|nr:MAG TPA: Reovirus sigma C capsid protein [Caudoviricetes sp.]